MRAAGFSLGACGRDGHEAVLALTSPCYGAEFRPWGSASRVVVLLAVGLLLTVGPADGAGGALDTGFGQGGTVTTAIRPDGSDAYALALQPDGKILVGGSTTTGSESEFAVARYSAAGALDPSFGTGGTVTTAIGSFYDHVRALLVQPDGKILAAGGSYDGSEYEVALVRYNPDGSLDSSFGSGGKVTTATSGPGGGEAYALALQPDGKIVVGAATGNNTNFVIARYNADGSPDMSFGSGGLVMTNIGYLRALELQPDGKIVAAGSSPFWNDVAVAFRLQRGDGSLDTSFRDGRHRRHRRWGSDNATGLWILTCAAAGRQDRRRR